MIKETKSNLEMEGIEFCQTIQSSASPETICSGSPKKEFDGKPTTT